MIEPADTTENRDITEGGQARMSLLPAAGKQATVGIIEESDRATRSETCGKFSLGGHDETSRDWRSRRVTAVVLLATGEIAKASPARCTFSFFLCVFLFFPRWKRCLIHDQDAARNWLSREACPHKSRGRARKAVRYETGFRGDVGPYWTRV